MRAYSVAEEFLFEDLLDQWQVVLVAIVVGDLMDLVTGRDQAVESEGLLVAGWNRQVCRRH